MKYSKFLAILQQNQLSIQAYMRLVGLSPTAYVKWKKNGVLPAWRAEQVINRLGVKKDD